MSSTESVHLHTWCDTGVGDMWWYTDQLRWSPLNYSTDEYHRQTYWQNRLWNTVWGKLWILQSKIKGACILYLYNYFTYFMYLMQTLNQVTPNPSEVKAKAAVQHKNKNRSTEFLPREYMTACMWIVNRCLSCFWFFASICLQLINTVFSWRELYLITFMPHLSM